MNMTAYFAPPAPGFQGNDHEAASVSLDKFSVLCLFVGPSSGANCTILQQRRLGMPWKLQSERTAT